MKINIPWQIKFIAKIILTRLPFNYCLWRRLNLFKHGHMTNAEYALQVFEKHFNRVNFQRKNDHFIALELGPGDSLFSAIIAHSFGAKCCYMVDDGSSASMKKSHYLSLVKLIQDRGMLCEINKVSLVSDLIEHCGGIYYTDGLDSLKTIPDQSVDFIWSHAVLEHIRLHEFNETIHELRRVVRADGICSHRVDLKDHLGGNANNLRFSRRIWETDWMASSGFYTNRLRFKEMMDKFKGAGFDIHLINKDKWQDIPISRKELAFEFRELTNTNLRISGFDVILKPSD